MTFLELVQRACSESGTVPGEGRPTSISGARAMEGKFVAWTNSAWNDIQLTEMNWLWMRAEQDCPVISGQSKFSPAALVARFNGWITHQDGHPIWTLYDPATGLADSDVLYYTHYADALCWSRGAPVTGRPTAYSITPQNEVLFNTVLDKTYTLRVTFRRSPQTLVADLDTPECPSQYHEAIVFKALIKASVFDEGMNQVPYWTMEFNRLMSNLRSDQLPRIRLGRPLA